MVVSIPPQHGYCLCGTTPQNDHTHRQVETGGQKQENGPELRGEPPRHCPGEFRGFHSMCPWALTPGHGFAIPCWRIACVRRPDTRSNRRVRPLGTLLSSSCSPRCFTIGMGTRILAVRNLFNVLRQISEIGILAVGMTWSSLQGIDLSVGRCWPGVHPVRVHVLSHEWPWGPRWRLRFWPPRCSGWSADCSFRDCGCSPSSRPWPS